MVRHGSSKRERSRIERVFRALSQPSDTVFSDRANSSPMSTRTSLDYDGTNSRQTQSPSLERVDWHDTQRGNGGEAEEHISLERMRSQRSVRFLRPGRNTVQQLLNQRSSSDDEEDGHESSSPSGRTMESISATLMKPDKEIFSLWTAYFLDNHLEGQYQDYTTVHWFPRARWYVLLLVTLHFCACVLLYALPTARYAGLVLIILSHDSVWTWCMGIYMLFALPFSLLPRALNPFQYRWRSWICVMLILFVTFFQIWLADANKRAFDVYKAVVNLMLTCKVEDWASLVNGDMTGLGNVPANMSIDISGSLLTDLIDAEAKLEQLSATRAVQFFSDALVKLLATYTSLFSLVFAASIRLEFVQMTLLGVTSLTAYIVIMFAYSFEVEYMSTTAFVFGVVASCTWSHASGRINRRSYLSHFVVERENLMLQSILSQAEAELRNGDACEEERQVVQHVLNTSDMQHLALVHIAFSDLTFLQAVGKGSVGDVIKAKYFGTVVVCKRMRREMITPDALASFRDEIELMACLRHPNIVQFIGASWDNCSNLCIVMEYLENGDMHSVLHSSIGGGFTWSDPLLKMAIDVVQGMLYLHSQEASIVHRDLKSVNVLCSATYGCKVGDFGLSRRYRKDVDALKTQVGTPFWLAPEIIRNENYGCSADVYSFGIVLTELETRQTPYHDVDDSRMRVLSRVSNDQLRPSLPPNTPHERRQLIKDCLKNNPADRPTFSQVLARLQGPIYREIEIHTEQDMLDPRLHLRSSQAPGR